MVLSCGLQHLTVVPPVTMETSYLDDPFGVLQNEVDVVWSQVLQVADSRPHPHQGPWAITELREEIEG